MGGIFFNAVSAAIGGGGGSSGLVSHRADLETQHTEWLDDIDTIIDAALLAASPYDSATAYNPAPDIATMETRLSDFADVVAGIDDEIDWARFVDRALTKADEVLFDETVLTNARTAFSNRVEDSFLSGINNLSTWAGGVGATDSSSFHIGIALLEMDRTRKVDDFDSSLQFELYKLRGQFMIQGTQQMTNILSGRVSGETALSVARNDAMKSTIIANKEENDLNIDFDFRDSLYDIKLFGYGAQMMGAIAGGEPGINEPGTAQSVLGAAAAGYAVGGPWGAAIGGGAALLGSFL